MRAGEVVQQGAIDEVWRAPADPETALFLGYARVLDGPAAAAVLSVTTPPGRLAVRRSAFRLDPEGPLSGRVVEARVTPEQVRLVVDVDGVGLLDAVAPLDEHPGPGQAVRLSVDATRTAPVGGSLH
jgi:thiamine transport system ATP-binding protein